MAVEGRLRFNISELERNYKRATRISKAEIGKMKADARGFSGAFEIGLKGIGSKIAGFLGVGMVAAKVKESLQWADDIADLTQKLNESAEVIQRVDYVSQQAASVGVDQIAKAMLKLEDNLGDLQNTRVADSLGRIGISARDLVGLPLDEKIKVLAGAFQEARKHGVGVADMTELVGRQAAELIPLLNLSKEALDGMFADAPALADQSIQRMAALNDKFDAMVMKSKAWIAQQVDEVAEWGRIAGDFVTTGSATETMLRIDDRATEATQQQITREEAREMAAASQQRKRDELELAKAREEASKAEEAAMEQLATIKAELEKADFDLLPDDEKIAALKEKLEKMLKETVGLFWVHEESIAGLETLAKAREEMGDALPETGTNSALEAFTWLQEARQLQSERAAIEKSLADKEKEVAERLASEVDRLMAAADDGAFQLLSPEEQAQKLIAELGDSFGFDIRGAEDIERGLKEARDRVTAANSDEERKVALERLIEAQEAAKGLANISTTAGDDQSALVNGRGTVAGAVANIFGRSSADLQLDEAKVHTGLLSRMASTLDKILQEAEPDPFAPIPVTFP